MPSLQVGSLTNWSNISGGTFFCLALKTDGTLWAWGQGGNGNLGLGNRTYYSSPKQVGSLTTWAKIGTGSATSFGITTAGALWGWGSGSDGQIGLGNTTSYSSPVQVGSLTTWNYITSGSSVQSTFGTKTDGTLWCWGRNFAGQLGLGNTTYFSSPKQIGSLTGWQPFTTGGRTIVVIKA